MKEWIKLGVWGKYASWELNQVVATDFINKTGGKKYLIVGEQNLQMHLNSIQKVFLYSLIHFISDFGSTSLTIVNFTQWLKTIFFFFFTQCHEITRSYTVITSVYKFGQLLHKYMPHTRYIILAFVCVCVCVHIAWLLLQPASVYTINQPAARKIDACGRNKDLIHK